MIRWAYKTVHFEMKKEGLLGGAFLDESEIEQELNEFGRTGWELVSMLEMSDGVIAFFKQPLSKGLPVASDDEPPFPSVEQTAPMQDIAPVTGETPRGVAGKGASAPLPPEVPGDSDSHGIGAIRIE